MADPRRMTNKAVAETLATKRSARNPKRPATEAPLQRPGKATYGITGGVVAPPVKVR